MKHLILFVCFLLVFASSWAFQVKGIVSDAGGEPIPYANVYVEMTTNGVVTNLKGEYYLDLPNGNHRLVFSSLGYKSKTVELEVKGHNLTVDVTLENEGVELPTVTLTGRRKDPAYAIMEKVIAQKKDYIQQFESFQCETYLKASLEVDSLNRKQANGVDSVALDSASADSGTAGGLQDNGSIDIGAKFFERMEAKKQARLEARAREKAIRDSLSARVHRSSLKDGSQDSVVAKNKRMQLKKRELGRPKLNFIESLSTTHYQYAGRYKSVIHGYRNLSEETSRYVSFSASDAGEDRYRMETKNPFLFFPDASEADFNFYRNLISVPKLADQPFISPLSSTSWNLTYRYHLLESFYEDGYVIHKIRVSPRNSEGPYFEGELYIEDGSWAIKSVNFQVLPTNLSYFDYFQVIHNYARTGDGRWVKTKEDYYYNVKSGKDRYYGNTTALHGNYQLDVAYPSGYFSNELRRVEKEAFDRDSLYWASKRPIALKEAEIAFIHEQDSLYEFYHSEKYLHEQDSAYNKLTIWDVLFSGIGFRIREHGLTFRFYPLSEQFRPLGVGGYRHVIGGTISKRWTRYHRLSINGDLDIGFQNQDIRGQGTLSYLYNPKHFASGYISCGDKYDQINAYTTLVTVFSRSNYVRKQHFGLGHNMEVINGLYLDVGLEWANYTTISDMQLEKWSLAIFDSSNSPMVFNPFAQAMLIAKLKWIPGQKFYSEPYRKVILGSIWPTFELEYRKASPGIWGSKINFDYLELHVTDEMRIGTMGISRWSAYAGTFLQKSNIRFMNHRFFRGSDNFLFANPLRSLQNLDTTLSTTEPYVQVNYLHDFGSALSNKIPLIKRTPIQFTVGAGILYIHDIGFLHSELFGGIQLVFRINRQRIKLGGYYTASYGNYVKAIGNQLKVGISLFDSFRNRWRY
ncbi:MAG: hypothetical protein RLZZ165_1833 [Bacteroidota bacterium]|jgi:hypothetical protein